RTFFTGAQQAGHDLVAVERFAPAILFDDHVGNFVDPLVAGEPSLAFQAFAASANGISFARFARINNSIFEVSAEWALHKISPPIVLRNGTTTNVKLPRFSAMNPSTRFRWRSFHVIDRTGCLRESNKKARG